MRRCAAVQSVLFSAKGQEDSRQRLKKEKHEKMLDAVAKSVGDLLLSVLIFGGMVVALYYGSI